jgi:hypothetical protein
LDLTAPTVGMSIAMSILFILIVLIANQVKEVWTHWGRGQRGGVLWSGFRTRLPFFDRNRSGMSNVNKPFVLNSAVIIYLPQITLRS